MTTTEIREEVPLLPAARPWARFLARIFDIWLSIFIVAFVFGAFAGIYWGGFPDYMQSATAINLFSLLLLPPALVVDVLIRKLFGNTPGKALLGISVIDARGLELDNRQYLGRNFNLWLRGLGLGIPLVSLITMIVQYNRLSSGGRASYDELGRSHVVCEAPGPGRKVVFGALFAVLLLVAVGSLLLDPEHQVDGVVYGPMVWTNHYTGNRIDIDDNWRYQVQHNNLGFEVEVWWTRDNQAYIVFAGEYMDGEQFEDYVDAFLDGTAETMRLTEQGFNLNGSRPLWSASGNLVNEPDTRLIVDISPDRSEKNLFWRIVSVQQPPHADSDAVVAELREKLLGAW